MLSAGGTDTYAYLGATETVAGITNSVGGTIRSMLDAGGSRLATRAGAATATFTLFDHLGSLIGLVGSTRTITEATRFDGYGESVDHHGATVSPWRFRGQLDISPTGDALYDMGARFYAPSLAAFTQMDTVAGSAQDPLSMNRFLYAQGNPATLIDPTGHAACSAYADYCTTNGSNKVTVQNTAKHTGKLKAGQSGRSWLNQRRDRDAESRVTGRRITRSAATRSPTMSWRDRYKAVLADYNSRLTPSDEWAIRAEEARTHEARTGHASQPWTLQDVADTLSYAPVIGTPADIASAIGYGSKGDWGNAGLAILSILPIGDALRLGKAGVKGASEAIEIASGGGDIVRFAHGTSDAAADAILRDGVNEAAIRANDIGSHEPGSFFTVRVDPADPDAALQTAAAWGSRHGPGCAVVVCELPTAVASRLEQAGLLTHRIAPVESVFRPGSYDVLNQFTSSWYKVPTR